MTALPACAVVAVITAFAVSQAPQLSLMVVATAVAAVVAAAMVIALAMGSLSGRSVFGDRVGQHRRCQAAKAKARYPALRKDQDEWEIDH